MSINHNKEASRQLYVEVFGKGNFAVADDLMRADVLSHGPGSPAAIGTDGIKRQAALLRAAIPDLDVKLEDQLAEGDRVASRWSATGTFRGELRMPTGTIPPNGKPIAFTEIRVDRFVDGKIAESWFIPDRFTLWQHLGLIPTAPPRS